MQQGTNAHRRDQDQRELAYEARSAAQVLAGDLPAEASGVFFREAERLLCRTHLTAEHLRSIGDEPGVVTFGFPDCDACRVDAALDQRRAPARRSSDARSRRASA